MKVPGRCSLTKLAETTYFTFKSSLFNTSEDKESFVNPGCFGDDVCEFFIKRLKNSPLNCDEEPIAEDWGWGFIFEYDKKRFFVGCGFNVDYECWLMFIDPQRSLIQMMFGKSDGVPLICAQAIHNALSESIDIIDLKWHRPDEWDRALDYASKGITHDIGSDKPF